MESFPQMNSPIMAVITGSGNGIGKALALYCANKDIHLILMDINNEALNQTKQEIHAFNKNINVITFAIDVSNNNKLRTTILPSLHSQQIASKYRIKYLFNCAGIFDVNAMVTDQSAYNKLQKTMNINLWGYINTIQCFLSYLDNNNTLSPSWIVNVSSIAGLESGMFFYGVTKAAICSYSEVLYRELQSLKKNIKVMVVCPSTVNTNLLTNSQKILSNDNANTLVNEDNYQKQAAMESLTKLLKSGITSNKMCELIFDGIRNNKFYVHSDPLKSFAVSKARFNSIITGDFKETGWRKMKAIWKERAEQLRKSKL